MKKFDLGQVVMTRGVAEIDKNYETHKEISHCLLRHYYGDWGDLCEEDKQANDDALKNGDRLVSAYTVGEDKTKIWIITEWDRSATTILLPEEY